MKQDEIELNLEIGGTKKGLFALLLASPFLVVPAICLTVMFFMGKVNLTELTYE